MARSLDPLARDASHSEGQPNHGADRRPTFSAPTTFGTPGGTLKQLLPPSRKYVRNRSGPQCRSRADLVGIIWEMAQMIRFLQRTQLSLERSARALNATTADIKALDESFPARAVFSPKWSMPQRPTGTSIHPATTGTDTTGPDGNNGGTSGCAPLNSTTARGNAATNIPFPSGG